MVPFGDGGSGEKPVTHAGWQGRKARDVLNHPRQPARSRYGFLLFCGRTVEANGGGVGKPWEQRASVQSPTPPVVSVSEPGHCIANG